MSVRHGGLAELAACLGRIGKALGPATSARTGRRLRAAVLHGPCNLKLEHVAEEAVRPAQVRVDVRYCGLTGSDALLWRGEHRRVPEPRMVLGSEVSGTILEMGGLAHEHTGYQVGEEVVVHNRPACGGLAENCLADYRGVFRLTGRASAENAATAVDDYLSALLALGRRARVRRGERFLVNARRSRSALAVVDLATGLFGAEPIAVCSDARLAVLCADLGAAVVHDGNGGSRRRLPCELREIAGAEEVRVLIETEGGRYFRRIVECLENDGLVAFLGHARDGRCRDFYDLSSNYTVFAAAAEHYKLADTLVYRESMEQLLDYRSECVIRPGVTAIFGLHRVNEAFEYYATTPAARVLIDMKDRDRLCVHGARRMSN